MKQFKLTITTIQGQSDLFEALKPLGTPFEHKTTKTEDGTMHIVSYIFETSMEAENADKVARASLDEFGIHPERDAHVMTFFTEGTWEKLVLVH